MPGSSILHKFQMYAFSSLKLNIPMNNRDSMLPVGFSRYASPILLPGESRPLCMSMKTAPKHPSSLPLVFLNNLFIYLFNSRNKSGPSSPRDMWQSNANKGKRGLLPALGRSATTKGIRRPPQCAVRKTRGQEYPHTVNKGKKKSKRATI